MFICLSKHDLPEKVDKVNRSISSIFFSLSPSHWIYADMKKPCSDIVYLSEILIDFFDMSSSYMVRELLFERKKKLTRLKFDSDII